MKAIVYHEFGNLDGGEYIEISIPELKAGEVLVKVAYAGVIPFDIKVLDKTIPMPHIQFPFIPGAEFSGEIIEIGADVNGWEVGDLVCGNPKRYGGAFAEVVAVKASQLSKIPKGMSLALSAASPVSALAAWHGLFEAGNLQTNQKVLIVGASGNVGSFAVQFAKQKGAEVFAIGSAAYRSEIINLGASHYLDYKNEHYLEGLPPFDLIMDMVGGNNQKNLFPLLKEGGCIVSLVQEPDSTLANKYKVNALMLNSGPNPKQLEIILEDINKGRIKVKEIKEYSLSDEVSGFEAMKDHTKSWKVLLKN